MQLKHALAGAAAAAAAFAAAAGPLLSSTVTLYGGGATFPAPAYVGTSYRGAGSRLTNPPDSGSVFDGYKQSTAGVVNVSYCLTGSGVGIRVLDGTPGYAATNLCPSFAVSATGFGKPATGIGPLDDADFVASDVSLSQSEFITTITNKSTHTQAVQFPVLAGSVGIAFNHPDAATLNLTTTQLCGVFNGTITTWAALGITVTGSNPTNITVQVGSEDDSGLTFWLSSHLAAVCNSLPGITPKFMVSDHAYLNNVVTPASGSTFVSSNGDLFAVLSVVGNTPGSIGYGGIADGAGRIPPLKFATINGYDPVANLVSPNVTLKRDYGSNCVIEADPGSYADETSSYPIIAVTNLLGYMTGNGDKAPFIQGLFTYTVNNTSFSQPGYVALSPFVQSQITSAIRQCVLP